MKSRWPLSRVRIIHGEEEPERPAMLGSLQAKLNQPNRRIRTRMSGGVGGGRPRGPLLSRFVIPTGLGGKVEVECFDFKNGRGSAGVFDDRGWGGSRFRNPPGEPSPVIPDYS